MSNPVNLKLKNDKFVNIDEMCSFHFNFNYDILKEAIKFLYNQLNNHASILDQILNLDNAHSYKENITKIDPAFPSLLERITRLEEIFENNSRNLPEINYDKLNVSVHEENDDVIDLKEEEQEEQEELEKQEDNKTKTEGKGIQQVQKIRERKEEAGIPSSSSFNEKEKGKEKEKEIGEILEIKEKEKGKGKADKKNFQRKTPLEKKEKNSIDNNKPETLNQKFDELDGEIGKINEKLRQIFKHLSLISAKPGVGIGLGKQDLTNSQDLSIIETKIQKVKVELRNEMKSQYTPLTEYQNNNCSTEKKITHLSDLSKMLSESISLKFDEVSKTNKEMQIQLKKFEKQISENNEVLNSINEINEIKSPRNLNLGREEKPNELPMEPIEPISPTHRSKPSKQYVLSDNHLKNSVNELGKRLNEMQIQINLLKQNQSEVNEKRSDSLSLNNEFILKELIETNPKIASKLDIKTLQSIVNDLTSRFDHFKKDFEHNFMNMPFNSFQEEVNSIKQSIISLDNKGQTMSKSLKIIENKLSEGYNFGFGFVDTVQSKQDMQDKQDEPIKMDDKYDAITDEFNQKVSEIRDTISILKGEYIKFTKIIDNKIEGKVGNDDLIHLETKFYKELDKVVSSLTKKIYLKVDITKFHDLDTKLRKLKTEIVSNSPGIKNKGELNEDAMLTKKPLGGVSCASCEKDIIDLYSAQLSDRYNYNPWNKFPTREQNENLKLKSNLTTQKILSKRIKKEIDNLNFSNNFPNNFDNISSLLPNEGTHHPGLQKNIHIDSPENNDSKIYKKNLPRIKKV